MTLPTLYCDVLRQNHTLVAGCTGSGKSVFLDGVICVALARGDVGLVLCDPKMVDLRKYAQCDNTMRYADTHKAICDSLEDVIAEMYSRYADMQRQGQAKSTRHFILVVIDELADLFVSEYGSRIKRQVQKLTALGRAANIHLLCASQSPAAKILPTEITLNFTARIALHCQTATQSRQIIGEKGAECLAFNGECLYLRPNHYTELWRVPMLAEYQTNEIINNAS